MGGTPAQAVQHALLEIVSQKPDLVVSGINYGENIATGITISGTVGAAMEAAAAGIPAMAVSLETDKIHHLSYQSIMMSFSELRFISKISKIFQSWFKNNIISYLKR